MNNITSLLDGMKLAGALRAGTTKVIKEQKYLNKINVFPVPDADTGTNLASTLKAVFVHLNNHKHGEAGKAAKVAAEAALMEAKGNSGAIFAQFLYGFAESIQNLTSVNTRQFALAAENGVNSAYSAIFQPREGTILSVIREWANELKHKAEEVVDFSELIPNTIAIAQKALANTTKQLDVLTKNKVVDAGGQGFLYFLHGIAEFVQGKFQDHEHEHIESLIIEAEEESSQHEIVTDFRFCTEALIQELKITRNELIDQVKGYGDSLVVAGSDEMIRVHIHTNEPRAFFEDVAKMGTISKSKVDDMFLMQGNITGKVAIVSDSTCDLKEEVISRIGLYRVPLQINCDGVDYRDGETLAPAPFYQMADSLKSVPTTSQPAIGDFIKTYKELLKRYDHIISIHLAATLSGTLQAAQAAAKQFADRITIIDSNILSAGLGVTVEEVGKALLKGTSLEEAIEIGENIRPRLYTEYALHTVKFAVMSGRLNKQVGQILEFLKLKPMVRFQNNGLAKKTGAGFGMKHTLKKIANNVEKFSAGKIQAIRVAHADAKEDALWFADYLKDRFELDQIDIVQAGAVLGTHAGKGTVGLVALKK